jgi:hypothetical protein
MPAAQPPGPTSHPTAPHTLKKQHLHHDLHVGPVQQQLPKQLERLPPRDVIVAFQQLGVQLEELREGAWGALSVESEN